MKIVFKVLFELLVLTDPVWADRNAEGLTFSRFYRTI